MKFIAHKLYKNAFKDEYQLNHVKEHIQIVYSYIKDYLDNLSNEEHLTIVDEDSPLVHVQLWFENEKSKTIKSIIYGSATVINGPDYVIEEKDEKEFFKTTVTPLFLEYSINCQPDEKLLTPYELEKYFIEI